MYSTCLFCRADLGRNELIETFPVGRRLAVDPAKGRLWVICSACKRWNLSPLEERWEAMESIERLIEKLRPEARSDNIALFAHPSGVRLVHIGSARWRELTHWRYGARLNLRRRWAQVRSISNIATIRLAPQLLATALLPAYGLAGVVIAGAGIAGVQIAWQLAWLSLPVAKLRTESEAPITIRGKHLGSAQLFSDSPNRELSLSIKSDQGIVALQDSDALRVLGRALIHFNPEGAGRQDLDIALSRIGDAGSSERYVGSVLESVAVRQARRASAMSPIRDSDFNGPIHRLPDITRLALEIASHDQIESRALEGELAMLDRMWKEAEEIAAISDDLLMPRFVTDGLRRLRGT